MADPPLFAKHKRVVLTIDEEGWSDSRYEEETFDVDSDEVADKAIHSSIVGLPDAGPGAGDLPPGKEDYDDECQIVSASGSVACADFPHSRHLCLHSPMINDELAVKLAATHCAQCYCYVCDVPVAQCAQWLRHCYAAADIPHWDSLRAFYRASGARIDSLAASSVSNLSSSVDNAATDEPAQESSAEAPAHAHRQLLTAASTIRPDQVCDRYAPILQKLARMPAAEPFRKPVAWKHLGLSDYLAVIKSPMDFATCIHNLDSHLYPTAADLRADVDLIFSNAITYNGHNSWIMKYVSKMQEAVRMQFDKAEGPRLAANISTARSVPAARHPRRRHATRATAAATPVAPRIRAAAAARRLRPLRT